MEPSILTQVFASFAACLGAMGMGAVLGYSSPTGPIFLRGDSLLKLTELENSWAASIVTIGAIIGCPIGGIAMKYIGRRFTLIWSLAPYLTGWVFIAAAQTFSMLLIGRFICGICIGITCVIVPMFIGEFATPNIRGALTTMFQVMVAGGILFVYVLGIPFNSFRWIAAVSATPCILHSVLLIFCKESPTYLLLKGRHDDAKDALQFYRGKHYDVSKELEAMQACITENNKIKMSVRDLLQPKFLRPLIIAMGLQIFQQASGVNAVLFNLGIIFQDAGTSLSANQSSIIVGSVLTGVTIVSAGLVEKVGRKILLMVSSFFMTVSLLPLGVYFYFKEQAMSDEEALASLTETFGWVPLTSMIVYVATFSIGYGSIPWVIMGEVFTPEARDLASSIATISNWTTTFWVTSSFIPIQNSIGAYGAYWIFAGICAVNFLFCAFVVPETKGKTIEEITRSFDKSAAPKPKDVESK